MMSMILESKPKTLEEDVYTRIGEDTVSLARILNRTVISLLESPGGIVTIGYIVFTKGLLFLC